LQKPEQNISTGSLEKERIRKAQQKPIHINERDRKRNKLGTIRGIHKRTYAPIIR